MLGVISRRRMRLLFWCCLFLLPLTFAEEEQKKPPKCLTHRPDVIPKKYPHYMGQPAVVTVETSRRPLHRISTEIFRIFLEEILGFARVKILNIDDDFNFTTVIERLASTIDENVTFPSAMINLEVWVPAVHDTMKIEDHQVVKDSGNSIPSGRFGWFIPKVLQYPIKQNYKGWSEDTDQVHWTFFKDYRNMWPFVVEGAELELVKRNSREPDTNEYVCTEKFCRDGMFTPPQCTGSTPCAMLMTEYTNRTKYVVEHIKELKLYVKVVWLGTNLKKVMDTLTKTYRTSTSKSLIVLYWTPSETILRESRYLSVIFPRCDPLNTSKSIGCVYETQRLIKFSWNKLETIDRILFQAVRSFKFEEDDFDALLDIYEYRTHDNWRILACDWMRNRTPTWDDWRTESDSTDIFIGGIFPISGSSYHGAGIVRGAQMAKEAINRNQSILPNHKINLIVSNGQCRPDSVMKSFIDYIVDGYYNNLIGVLGPACSDTVEPLAGVSKHYRIMVISYSAEGASFSDRQKYPYFFRTIGENKHYKHVYLQMFKKLGWRRVAALTEDGQKYTEYISLMQELLEKNGITVISNTKFPREKETFQMTRYLEDLNRKRARIIILDVFDEIARTVMCEASKLKMTSSDGYVWFLPSWLNDTWYDVDYFNVFKHEHVNCTTAEMIKASTGYFSMAHAYFAPDDAVVPENITVAQWKVHYEDMCRKAPVKPGTSPYAGYAYDAVWTYAMALDTLIKTDPEAVSDIHSENTTNKLVQLIKDTDFNGVSGRIKFRGGPSRFSVINLMQWYDNQSHIVGFFTPNLTDDKPEILGGELKMNFSLIRWFTPKRDVPKDGALPPPVCALEGLAKFFGCDCETAFVIINILVISSLLVAGAVVLFLIKRRYERRVKYTEKYMRQLGINLLSPNMEDLDKWEIPRSAVVINRKLGEGAFGMVYAGDAEIPKKGRMAIAVKTLKVGSTTEEKLDFLSEAEVMKRFDHKNIVQLLGVVTADEPIFTIMEFMLYGDLKTYLLARRHLVNDSIEESEEVSSKRLTQMALDVARGLSYLSELKYVHRDVASRNCLINEQRVVKLADFGMTRPMFQNDYYKFTRKGMLPVRWMAPESLALGVFTPASDVWGYGVLLYEIVTFGGFPYQAMSNLQVLDHVKAGNTITLPQGIKPQLQGLMKTCWHVDPKSRTRASEIVEFLANNPRLLVPCLDVPLASIQLQDTNQFEINLPDQFRKCSASDIKTSPTIPNGVSSYSFDAKQQTLHEQPDNWVGIAMQPCGPKEPLLGPAKSSSSLLNLGKYVGLPSGNGEAGASTAKRSDDDYLEHDPETNSFAISKV